MAGRAGSSRGCCGCAVLLFATSSGVGRYMPAMFSMHMAAHMLLSMLVPILLVLGAPVTLALAGAARRGARRSARPARMAAGRAAQPGVAVPDQPDRRHRRCSSSGFYGLYFGGIFDAAVGSHAAHVAMNLHFLLSGYLFYWVVIGVDPTPRPIPPMAKLAMVFASLPLHAFFGVVLMGTKTVLGGDFYRSLQLSWHTDLLGDQRLGGGIAWAAGEVPLVLVLIALLIQWRRSDQRTAKRLDRAADRDDDADLAAYNAMLAEMAQRESQAGAEFSPAHLVTSARRARSTVRSSSTAVPRGDACRRRPAVRSMGCVEGGDASRMRSERTHNVRDTDYHRRQHRHRSDPPPGRRSGADQVPGGQQFAPAHRRRRLGAGQLAVRHGELLGTARHRRGCRLGQGRPRHRRRPRLHQRVRRQGGQSAARRWRCGPPRWARIWPAASRASTAHACRPRQRPPVATESDDDAAEDEKRTPEAARPAEDELPAAASAA